MLIHIIKDRDRNIILKDSERIEMKELLELMSGVKLGHFYLVDWNKTEGEEKKLVAISLQAFNIKVAEIELFELERSSVDDFYDKMESLSEIIKDTYARELNLRFFTSFTL